MEGADLFAENLALLDRIGMGLLAARLRAFSPGRYELTGDLERGSLNLRDVGTGLPYYSSDALTHAFETIQSFRKVPTRHLIQPLLPTASFDLCTDRVIRACYEYLTNKSINTVPTADAGAFVLFGLGLGLQLPLITQHFMTKDLVIYEPDLELVFWALHLIPMVGIEDLVRRRGGRLIIVTEAIPNLAATEIIFALRADNGALIDGSYFMVGTSDPRCQETLNQVSEQSRFFEISSGFFEDELDMFVNTARNLASYDWHMLKDRPSTRRWKCPALVIGSGPSVDKDIETIRKLAENAIVFSCGSSLGVLLRNNITPDFHCQLENTTSSHDLLELTREDFDFSGVTLLAANSIDARSAALFEERVMYFMPANTGTRLFSDPEDPLFLVGPTVVNSALRTGVAMGLDEFYLFGVDLGSKDPEHHHSDATHYNHSDDPFWISGNDMERFSIPMEGNFGGQFLSNRPFQYTKLFLERLIANIPSMKVYNCSDGARIEGAEPRAPDTVSLKPASGTKAETVEIIVSNLSLSSEAAQDQQATLRLYRAALSDWFDAVARCFREGSDLDVYRLNESLKPYMQAAGLERSHGVDAAIRYCASGSVQRMMMLCHYLYRRLDPGDRAPFLEMFCDLCVSTLGDMKLKADQAFENL